MTFSFEFSQIAEVRTHAISFHTGDFSSLGRSERQRARLVTEAMRSHGASLGGDQDVLPRFRHRPQDELRQQERGPEVVEARAVIVHADDGCPHQELCLDSDISR